MRHLLVKIILGISTSAMIGGALATSLFSRIGIAKEHHKEDTASERAREPSSMGDSNTESETDHNKSNDHSDHNNTASDHSFMRAGRSEGGSR